MNDLKAFLDGELDAAAAATMQTRLQSDGSLAAAAADFRHLSASFGALTIGPTTTGRDRALAAVSAPRVVVSNWSLAGAVASVALVAFVAALLFPVFAQTKEAARRTAAMAESIQGRSIDSGIAGEESGNLSGSSPPPSEGFETNGGLKSEEQPYAMDMTVPPSRSTTSPTIPEQLFERKVVKTANLGVRVKSIDQAEAKVTAYVEGQRGYIENSTSSNLDGKSPTMTLTVRVPQQKFSEAMATFEKLGERTEKNIDSSDVTQAIVDMEARLKNLRSQEETYRSILRTARKVGEIIDVQERLSRIRGEIESMQAQRDSMAKLAAMSTITLTLSQRPPPEEAVSGGWVEDTWSSATYALGGALKSLSVMGIWILVYAPLWVPLSIVALWGWRRALRA